MNDAVPEHLDPARLRALAEDAQAWPFEEARKVVARLERHPKERPVIFETGYGPSGLPHIGTFGEVARTSMVRHAFRVLTEDRVPTRLICFSDDLDGLRKVPGNVPNREMLAPHLDQPLTRVPDPFGTHDSFGAHNNARLRAFLDSFGFDYEFFSATEVYRSGGFDTVLMRMLERFDEVMAIMLPTLREERRATYSPFLPISPKTGKVLQVPTLERHPERGTIVYEDEDGARVETPVTGGCVKVQWKPDWALRWTALGVDYEMAGKDLIDSVRISSRICKALGGTPPEGFNYELFLDEKGEKISKTKGNGLSIDEWLAYASPESLSYYMYLKPKTAKRLYFDVIPRAVDDYYAQVAAFWEETAEKRVQNPVWHIHAGEPPREVPPVSFAMLLNLVSASNAQDRDVLWGFIRRYAPEVSPENARELDRLVGYAIRYFHDVVAPSKRFRAPSETERAALEDLDAELSRLEPGADGEAIQTMVYEIGKRHDFANLRDWFKALYQVLLGQDQGPRFGSFVALYGIGETRALIGKALEGKLSTAA
jgi:lysyl-tRNA synthetase class 1